VTAFNGARYRQRPIADVVREFQLVREKHVLVVDDNLIGTHPKHIARAKDLFRAMARANLRKEWIAQATINIADDEELLALAAKAGCRGLYIGFETLTPEGLREIGKKFNLQNKGRDFRASVKRIRRHNILVSGSFIMGLDVDKPGIGERIADMASQYGVDMGLDVDKPGIGERIADMASQYGVDNLTVMFLTPLPGTRLRGQMESEGRIALDASPEDWDYYTLTFPVARYRNLSLNQIIEEMISCDQHFYSMPRILRRVWGNVWRRRMPLITLVANLSYRGNSRLDRKAYADFKRQQGHRHDGVRGKQGKPAARRRRPDGRPVPGPQEQLIR
jgi:radical SAM superfamily enzyme YgiQ (UPF0313 family)